MVRQGISSKPHWGLASHMPPEKLQVCNQSSERVTRLTKCCLLTGGTCVTLLCSETYLSSEAGNLMDLGGSLPWFSEQALVSCRLVPRLHRRPEAMARVLDRRSGWVLQL